MDVFAGIDRDAPLVVAEAVWQYSHHVLPGLRRHRGPILTVANWRGEWPGLVGMLNINASLTKMGRAYSSIWSDDMTDPFADAAIRALDRDRRDRARHEPRPRPRCRRPCRARPRPPAGAWRASWPERMAILGVFDEGCMGMYNAIIDDEYLNPMGIHKERLSQSALFAEMRLVSDREARQAYDWLRGRGMRSAWAATARPS